MTKRILAGMLAVAAALSLGACTRKALSDPTPRPTHTLPTIQTEIPPSAQLTQAIGKTVGTGAFVMRYGTIFQGTESMTQQQSIRTDEGYISLITGPDSQVFFDRDRKYIRFGQDLQVETSPTAYESQQVFADVRSFWPNANLIRDMTSHRLTVTPEADGSLAYVCGYLELEELGQILYGGAFPAGVLPEGYAKTEGKITFLVSSAGQFTSLQVDIDLYQSGSKPDDTFTMLLTVEEIGTLESIPTPEWIA